MERLRIEEIIDHCNRKVIWWEKLIPREKFENRDISDSGCREYWEHRKVAEYLNELQQYRKLEEQGKLLRLQFRVGDFVWDDEFKTRCKINGYSFGAAEDYIDDPVSETEVVYYYTNLGGSITGSFAECEIGKTMFHSKEEAEAALEKLEEESHGEILE